jgi:adenylate kinase
MNVILLGPPGAGKGTQATRLEAALGLPHIASGDIFRAIVRQNTSQSEEIRHYYDQGKYVPDDLTIQLLLDRLHQPDAKQGFLLDGFPRTTAQAEALDRALAKEGRRVDAVIHLSAPEELLLRRIDGRLVCPSCGAVYNAATNPPAVDGLCDVCGHQVERRSDEAPEVVRNRLHAYIEQTHPLVEYYRLCNCLTEIDASRSPDAVEEEIDMALGLTRADRRAPAT